MDPQAEIDDRMTCAFVLASSLYFRLEVVDRASTDVAPCGWNRLLHDTSCDLSALSDAWSAVEPVASQLNRGIDDLVESLRDLACLAHRSNQPQLGAELQGYADRLDDQLCLNRH